MSISRQLTILSLVLAACGAVACRQSASETDQKIAQLQKELDATKQQLESSKAGAPASPEAQPAAAPPESAPPSSAAAPAPAPPAASAAAPTRSAPAPRPSAGSAAAPPPSPPAEKAAGPSEAEKALQEQRAINEQQAKANAELKREIEEMKPRELTLPTGTVLKVRTTGEVSTSKVSDGSVFEGLLEGDLVADGVLLAKSGSRVTCVVVTSDKGGRVKGVASLTVSARTIAGAGGQPIAVRTDNYSVEARSTKGRDAARTGIMTGAGAVIGAIAGGGSGAAIGAGAGAAGGVGTAMATRGEAAVIPSETLMSFRLSSPTTVVHRP